MSACQPVAPSKALVIPPLMSSSDLVLVCQEHLSGVTISKSSFLMDALAAFSATANSIQVLESLSQLILDIIISGRFDLIEIIQGRSIWDVDECLMCCLVDFLLEKAESVFMMGLIYLNRRKTFEDYFALLPGYMSQHDFKRLKEGLLLYGEILGKESA